MNQPAPGELVLDHVSHFVPDLKAAAGLLRRLGFAVTRTSKQMADGQPVGSSNRCVMLEQGYIEILTPTHDTPVARQMRARMDQFVGVHLACFGTPDAECEHARLAAHGFAPQPLVHLRRGALRFKVVRPAPDTMPEGRIQYVQHLTPQALWTPRNLAHDNGVTGLQAVFVVADDPAQAAVRWARFSALLPRREGDAVVLEAARGRVVIASQFIQAPPARPALAGYALACRHPQAFIKRCAREGLAVRATGAGHAISLPASLGGVWLV